jgi:sulfate transport system ATP-binding protein
MSIKVEHVSKRFGAFTALDNIDLEVGEGELVALLGPSGSGKTTLLRVIAGLESADSGRVLFDGEDTGDLRVQQRNVGFVFQHYALFRHMTIFENVAFGLRVRPRESRPSDQVIREKVNNLLKMVQLDWLGDRYPHQLSGGQRQRIALARALAIEPRVLLLDEPFGALDAKVRKDLRRWLRNLHNEIKITSVFVTHDQEEALEVADRIVVFNNGRIEQVGTPDDVYDHPATPFVYGFLGHANRFTGTVDRGVGRFAGQSLDVPEYADSVAAPATAFSRPHEIDISATPGEGDTPARVEHSVKLGPLVRIDLARVDNGELIEAELPHEQFRALDPQPGQVVYLSPKRVRVFLDTPTREAA